MERVRYEPKGSAALLRMDDGKANAIQGEFLEQMDRAMTLAEADPEVRAIVIAGRDGFFSGGLDLKVLPSLDRETLRRTVLDFGRQMIRIFRSPKPVVAAVTGHAIAGGTVLALACDRRLGAAGPYKIGLSEVAIGLPLPAFVIEMARAVLAPSARFEAMGTGRIYDPDEARAAGYLDEVHELRAVVEAANIQANVLGALPALAFSETKRRLKLDAVRRSEETLEPEIDYFLRSGPFAV